MSTLSLRRPPFADQRGASLIMVMLILIIVSILGAGGAQIALMSERGARNDRDLQLAWQSAEAALKDAELDIRPSTPTATALRKDLFTLNSTLGFVPGCGTTGTSKGLCQPSIVGKPVWLSADLAGITSSPTSAEFGEFTGRAFDAGGLGVKPFKKPRYLVEALPDEELFTNKDYNAKRKYIYRVTAVGFGPREDIQAVVQMVYRKE
jgi:type IV pilus assembly protein PilX